MQGLAACCRAALHTDHSPVPRSWTAGKLDFFLQPHDLPGALFFHTWAFGVGDTLPCPSCCLLFFNPGHDQQLLPHERMFHLMKRFGSFRGSKKRKEQCKSLERRQSDPRGLFGRGSLHYPFKNEGDRYLGEGGKWGIANNWATILCFPISLIESCSCCVEVISMLVLTRDEHLSGHL